MENRSVFGFQGLLGMALAVGVVLAVVFTLAFLGVQTQVSQADKYYEIKDAKNIKMDARENAGHRVMYTGEK